MPPLSLFNKAKKFAMYNTTMTMVAGDHYMVADQKEDLNHRLNPILDASHTRDREQSPPDSACFPGTREEVIAEITTWADTVDLAPGTEGEPIVSGSVLMIYTPTPHIYWLHGFAGCGKSAVSLKVADIYEESGRLLASYFFFRDAGDRGTMKRFAATLASQLARALPETIPLIEGALHSEPGLLSDRASLSRQLECLVYNPFQAVMGEEYLEAALVTGPFIIVIDGLDECDDKRRVGEFIDHLLHFFAENPSIPLRVFIASRIEQHIRDRLSPTKVRLGNLDSHSPRKDIEKWLQASFQNAPGWDRIIQSYVRAHGAWPTPLDMNMLVDHIGGSFVLASTIFKFVFQPATETDASTPMERLPLALKMNGLDDLYTQTLSRSEHLPHFHTVISTIALLKRSLPVIQIAALLGIEAFEIIRVLLDLQAIIHVPGSDEEGQVMLCHTSLRDYLTTESRAGRFFVPLSFHVHLSFYSFYTIISCDGRRGDYCWFNFGTHWRLFAGSKAPGFLAGIEQFKNHPPVFPNRVRPNYHAFLCSMFFCSAFLARVESLSDCSYLLTECTRHLALAAESADLHTRLWLEKELDYDHTGDVIVQLTEPTHKALCVDLQRASTAIKAKFPGILEAQTQSTPTENEKEFSIYRGRLSGARIFSVLRWMLAQARYKWEKLNIAPRPPLELSIKAMVVSLEDSVSGRP
ncbi:hypothetical protein MD484_g7589, partial [Candolleomyces efflorescens]